MSRYERTYSFTPGTKAKGEEVKYELDALQAYAASMPTPEGFWTGSVNYVVAAGSPNAISISAPKTWTEYAGKDGCRFDVRISSSNTGVVTLNVNSLGAKSVVNPAGEALVAGDLKAGNVTSFVYNESEEKFYAQTFNGIGASAAAYTAQTKNYRDETLQYRNETEVFKNEANASKVAADASATSLNSPFIHSRISGAGTADHVVMSGSGRGIKVPSSVQNNFGIGDFTRHIFRVLPTTRPAANQTLYHKHDGSKGLIVTLLTTGIIRVTINTNSFDSTEALPNKVNYGFMGTVSVVRETVSADGSITIMVQGLALGIPITLAATTPSTITNTSDAYLNGTSVAQSTSTWIRDIGLNRAMTANEILAFIQGGATPVWADINASQTAKSSGTLEVGKRYIIDTFNAGDSFTNVGAASNASGVVFIATGTTPTTWSNSSSLRQIGIVEDYSADECQGNTGQVFDATANQGTALMPPSGATVFPPRRTFMIRARFSWTASDTSQNFEGGHPIFDQNAVIDFMFGKKTGVNYDKHLSIGDTNSLHRYCLTTNSSVNGNYAQQSKIPGSFLGLSAQPLDGPSTLNFDLLIVGHIAPNFNA